MSRLAVRAAGMVTAAGFNARSTCAAIRAGVSGVRTGNLVDPATAAPLPSGRPSMPHWWEGNDMLAELAAPAVLECLAALPAGTDRATVPVVALTSAAGRPHRRSGLDDDLLDGIARRLPYPLPAGSEALALGSTGLYEALASVNARFAAGEATHAVIVGVESFLRPEVVNAYIGARRILTEDNSNGFIPGEAACAVLVAPGGREPGLELLVTGWGRDEEPGTIRSDRPLTGQGLTRAVRAALERAGVRMAETHYWLTDQNAEHYKAKECTIAKIRLERRDVPADPPFQIWHPIEFLGEIGAAIGPCLFGLALAAARGGYAPGPRALMSLSEDDGRRAAFVLQAQGGA